MRATPVYEDILALPYESKDTGTKTIGGFLANLLEMLVAEGEGFDSKRPFGNSDWDAGLFDALEAHNYEPEDLTLAIRSLNRDPTPVQQMLADAEQARFPTTLTREVAESLIEKGWTKP